MILIPSCSPNHIHTKKERKRLSRETCIRIDQSITAFNDRNNHEPYMNFYNKGLSAQHAIGLAFEYNPELQSDLETLGIAKADLVQAGLLTNPFLETEYKVPRPKCNEHIKVELYLSFTLSDLWQVPRRKKVAKDELEITSMRISKTIIDIFTTTQIAYNKSLHALAQHRIAESILEESKKLKNRFAYRQQLGYSTEVDTNLAEVMMQHWEIEVINSNRILFNFSRELERNLGIKSTTQAIHLNDSFAEPKAPIPPLEQLESYALEYRPDLQIARLRIRQAKDRLAYEQSRFIPNVECGLAYERESDKKKLVGPLLNITLPVFDTNYAQVARARTEIKLLEKSYAATLLSTLTQIKQLHNNYNSLKLELERYALMMPSYKQAIAYLAKHTKNMQFTMLTLYQTYIAYYEEQSKALATLLELLNTRSLIEQAIGRKLPASLDANDRSCPEDHFVKSFITKLKKDNNNHNENN